MNIHITYAAVERVKSHVTGNDGKPLDLLDIAERGDFSAITGSVRKIIEVVFWLNYPEIQKEFGSGTAQELADKFGETLDGDAIVELVESWEAAMLDFIPNRRIRAAVEKVLEKQRTLQTRIIEQAETQALSQITDGLETLSGNLPENSESIPESSPFGN